MTLLRVYTDSPLEKDNYSSSGPSTNHSATPLPPKRLPRLVITLLIIGPVLLALAIGVPVGLAALRGSHSALAESQKESAGAKNSNKTQNRPGEPTSGGDGSVITLEDGTTFTYHNPFGGICKRLSFAFHSLAVPAVL